MGLNYIKVNLREIRNGVAGNVERVTLLNVESSMEGYRGLEAAVPAGRQVYELPYILHALAGTGLTGVWQDSGFPYSFPLNF